MDVKFYVKKEYNGRVLYKRYKCIEGWSADKHICWQFTKQAATKIAEREKSAVHASQSDLYNFTIERV